jgi:hypothetical protein
MYAPGFSIGHHHFELGQHLVEVELPTRIFRAFLLGGTRTRGGFRPGDGWCRRAAVVDIDGGRYAQADGQADQETRAPGHACPGAPSAGVLVVA